MITRLRSREAAARWLREWTTGTLRTDSREVQPGDAFIAWPGYSVDGRRFVEAALKAGAATCLVESEGVEAFGFEDARIGALPGLKAATGDIADAFFDHPSQTLRVVASTGTNGKTSTTWWVAQALSLLGQRCGVIGTLGVGEPPLPAGSTAHASAMPIVATGRTTPDPAVLHAGFHQMLRAGFQACAIEATSIGIVEQRLVGSRIEVALFTNFTRDHLDYHGSMDHYWAAKRQLFDWPGLKAAVLNLDDAQGESLAPHLADRLDLWTYSLERDDARLRARELGYVDGGLAFTLYESTGDGGQSLPVRSQLIGDYNAANLLAVIGGLRALGVPLADAVRVVPQLTAVPGRMQKVNEGTGQPQVVVDYAHTPDALEKALIALRPLVQVRGGRLVCVFGCGGNRDKTKRPLMGAIAARLADSVIVTSDNPRNESPMDILLDVAAGMVEKRKHVTFIEDRRDAITAAVFKAKALDVVLLAGKGHEDYQEVAGVKRPFSDIDEALRALAARGGSA